MKQGSGKESEVGLSLGPWRNGPPNRVSSENLLERAPIKGKEEGARGCRGCLQTAMLALFA